MTRVNEEHGLPETFGVFFYQQLEILDMDGPLDALNVYARPSGFEDTDHRLVSKTIPPVTVGPTTLDTMGCCLFVPQLYTRTY